LVNNSNGLGDDVLENINSSIANRKPTYLASILVDTLKESGWTAEDIHFLGVEIINESGML
jgi:hypothetical protein